MGLRRAVASALIAIAVAAPGVPAHAASEAVPDQTISGLDLTAIPSVIVRRTDKLGRLTGNYYPEVAYEEHIGGLAVIDCQVSPKGDLDGCAIIAQYPSGCFFGAAARKMAEMQAISAPPSVVSEHPSGSDVVRMKMIFNMFPIRSLRRC